MTDDEWYERAAEEIVCLLGPESRPECVAVIDETNEVALTLDRRTALAVASRLIRLAVRLDPPSVDLRRPARANEEPRGI